MTDRRTSTLPASGETTTKKCPMCAEQIQAEALVCHFCGARFSVVWHGYCTNCHGVVDATNEGACSVCAGELVDRQFVSELLTAPATGQPAPPPSAPAVTAPEATPSVQGELRAGYIGSWRQRLAEIVLSAAMAVIMVTTLLGFGGTDTFLFGVKPGIAEARPGVWYFFVPLIAVAVATRHLGPRSRKLDFSYRQRLNKQYGINGLYKESGAILRVSIATALWLLGLVLAVVFIGQRLDEGFDLRPGAYILVVTSAIGMLMTPFMLPGKDNPRVRIDDTGELFQ